VQVEIRVDPDVCRPVEQGAGGRALLAFQRHTLQESNVNLNSHWSTPSDESQPGLVEREVLLDKLQAARVGRPAWALGVGDRAMEQ
jgi:hypothetical protein